MQLSPTQIAGITSADGVKIVSPEAQDIIDRLRDHYRSQGKPSAAHNYGRHLKSFFAWAEGVGYTVKTLPVDAVESFLASLQAAGQKETTVYVMRTQLKSALREAHTVLGVDFAHLEYQIGKPKEVRAHQKAREKAKRHEAKAQQIMAQAAAIQAAQQMVGIAPQSVEPVSPVAPTPHPVPESPMSTASAPVFDGPTATGSPPAGQAAPQQPVVVVQMPPNNTRPTATIGNPSVPQTSKAGSSAPQPARGVVIANHTFTGPYVKISRIADGTEPLIPPGTETYVQTLPASQLAPHGDVAAFLQTYIVPNLRLSPAVTQVQFVFHELNDRRQPTGRRDELVVSVPMQGGSLNGFNAASTPPPTPGPYGQPSQDSATVYLLKKLDEEAADAKRRAEDYQVQMREAKDAQTTFMLMQAFQKEQDLRRELEERRDRMAERDRPLPPPTPIMPPMPFLPPPMPVETKPDTSMADMVKAMADQQAKMMETVATLMRPPPPQPQKDVAEWLVPFIAQMNQQAQSQAQANQQMLMSVMQGNQQFMQALLTRENPTERLLMQQLMEVKAAAAAPKADELEDFADKLQKMKMVGEMIGGGPPGGGLLSELLANADTIGAGAAKVIAAARNGGASVAAAPQPGQRMLVTPPTPPGMAGTPRQIPAQTAPQTTEAPSGPPRPPDDAVRALTVIIAAEGANDDQTVVNAVMAEINALLVAPEPFKGMGTRLLNALKTADDEGELYTMAKNLWTVIGQQYDRPVAKSVARILAHWYREIYMQVFGEERELPGNADTDTVRKAVDAMGAGETAPVIEEQEETDDEEQDEEQEEQDEQDGPEITDEGEEATA